MSITRQDILDRLDALQSEHGAAYRAEQARIAKERASLQELCGGMGHLFTRRDSLTMFMRASRTCLICGALEKSHEGVTYTQPECKTDQ